jgi:hypothetical protein
MANAHQAVSSMARLDITESIMQAISQSPEHSAYACGGTVEIEDAKAAQPSQAVTIRWDASHSIEKLTLPLPSNNTEKVNDSLAKLVQGTSPAGFEYQGKNVIDESTSRTARRPSSITLRSLPAFVPMRLVSSMSLVKLSFHSVRASIRAFAPSSTS